MDANEGLRGSYLYLLCTEVVGSRSASGRPELGKKAPQGPLPGSVGS